MTAITANTLKLIAAWALVRSLSRKAQTYSAVEKKIIWFWTGSGVIAVLLAWGHYAPFYQLFYLLPHASTISLSASLVNFPWPTR